MKWLRQFLRWKQTLGPCSTIAINILLLILLYFIVAQIHKIGFHFKWFKSEGSFTWDDVGVAVITGLLLGYSEISNRKKIQARETDRAFEQ
jgi:hypothetical protein